MPVVPVHHEIRILYVEDDPATRDQVVRILKSLDYRLLVAENGAQGLEQFHAHQPDIVLTDIMMPVMNGLEMARAIRNDNTATQIIVMTAFSDTDYMTEAIDIGVNQFVIKPIEIQRLNVAIERCIHVIQLRRHNEQLQAENIRAKKMEAVGILAGGMAHDFNNLLQVILGYVSLARMSAEPGSKTAEMLQVAERTSETARELSKKLLSLARGGESYAQNMHLEPLLRTAAEAELAKFTGIGVTFDIAEGLPTTDVDVSQMQQVFQHIITNACEAMPRGGDLRIGLRLSDSEELAGLPLEPGSYLHLQFADNGCGISAENVQKIFDPYYTTKEMGARKGMGLGLAICHSIVKHHHGTIVANSVLGQGSTLHIYLPVTHTGA